MIRYNVLECCECLWATITLNFSSMSVKVTQCCVFKGLSELLYQLQFTSKDYFLKVLLKYIQKSMRYFSSTKTDMSKNIVTCYRLQAMGKASVSGWAERHAQRVCFSQQARFQCCGSWQRRRGSRSSTPPTSRASSTAAFGWWKELWLKIATSSSTTAAETWRTKRGEQLCSYSSQSKISWNPNSLDPTSRFHICLPDFLKPSSEYAATKSIRAAHVSVYWCISKSQMCEHWLIVTVSLLGPGSVFVLCKACLHRDVTLSDG